MAKKNLALRKISKDTVGEKLSAVNSLDNLSEFLTDIKNSENSDSAIANAINSQLQVISCLKSPALNTSVFDLMVESLKGAVEKASSIQEKKEFQRSAAIMTNSIIFFLAAKLEWEGDKWSEEGRELLKSACDMVAESSIIVISTYAGVPLGGSLSKALLGKDFYQELINKGTGFFKKLFDWVGKKERLEQYRKDFYVFLLSVVDKLKRYHDFFGSPQALLRELILRYKDDLVRIAKDKTKDLEEIDPDNEALLPPPPPVPLPPFKDKTRIGRYPLIISSLIAAVAAVLYLFNWWGGDKWLEAFGASAIFDMLFTIHFALLKLPFIIEFLFAAVLIGFPIGGFRFNGTIRQAAIERRHAEEQEYERKIANEKRRHLKKIADEYYIKMADSFGI